MSGSQLVLGTAQLGMAYGIANRAGKPDQITANAIVRAAWENHICEFDTAQGYSSSEEVLGIALKAIGAAARANIITKIHPSANLDDRASIRRLLEESATRLGCRKLYGVMLHDEALLDSWEHGLGEMMSEMVDEGITETLGVSIYSPERALQAIEAEKISLIQIPTNILDRRFEDAGVFEAAESKGKTIYVRSVFLQGLILLAASDLPPGMKHAASVINKITELSKWIGLSPMEIAMAFVQTAYPNVKLVIGAETPEQVRQNVSIAGNTLGADQISIIKETFRNVASDLLNPACWPK